MRGMEIGSLERGNLRMLNMSAGNSLDNGDEHNGKQTGL